jgi:hypothetical protein
MKIEIFFADLKKEKQLEVLESLNTTLEDETWDVFPLAVLESGDNSDQIGDHNVERTNQGTA